MDLASFASGEQDGQASALRPAEERSEGQGEEDKPITLPNEMLRMDSVEGAAIRLALTYAQGNVTQAAEMLQISKATLYRKIKEHKLR